jgi:hypothetical protein
MVQTFARIPGLSLVRTALDSDAQRRVAAQALALHRNLQHGLGAENNGKQLVVKIPQPIRSEAHNLAEERKFYRLRVADPDTDQYVSCEHFPAYGSLHHSLTYFQRNHCIPEFAKQHIVPILSQLPAVQDVAKGAGKPVDALDWRMTMNLYELKEPAAGGGDPLFPYHVDIAQNVSYSI